MRRTLRMAIGLALSLAFWVGFGAVALRAQDDGALVGVKVGKGGVFHKPDCSLLKKAAAKNKVELTSVAAADADGFKPCQACKPGDSTSGSAGDAGAPVKTASGKTISTAPGIVFSRDVAPLLVANCVNCHKAGGNAARSKFEMASFNKVLKGGVSGEAIVAGKPEESELVLRITGQSDGPKMPPGNNNLAASTIDTISQWIKDGAKLDGDFDPNAPLPSYAPTIAELQKARLGQQSGEKRDEFAEAKGRERLKKAGSTGDFQAKSSAHFLLLSDLPKERADSLLKGMERHHKTLKDLLADRNDDNRRASAAGLDGPIKIGLYVFRDSKPFAEFVRGVENKRLDEDTKASANFDVEAPYIVAVDPLSGGPDPSLNSQAKKAAPAKAKGKRGASAANKEAGGPDESLEGLLVEQMAAAAISKAGKAPKWLSLALGAYLASGVDGRNRAFQNLRVGAAQQWQLGWPERVNDALQDKTDPGEMKAIGFSLVEWLDTTQRDRLVPFVRILIDQGGGNFNKIIEEGWGGTSRDVFVNEWGNWVAQNYPRGRN